MAFDQPDCRIPRRDMVQTQSRPRLGRQMTSQSSIGFGIEKRDRIKFEHRTLETSYDREFDNIAIYGGIDLKRPSQVQIYFAGIDDEIEISISNVATIHKLMEVLMNHMDALKVKKEKKVKIPNNA
jgi:hypothetical protein